MSNHTDEYRVSKIFVTILAAFYYTAIIFIIIGALVFYGYILSLRFFRTHPYPGCSCDECEENRAEYDRQLDELSQTNTPMHLTYNIDPEPWEILFSISQ
jgi:hypothetical protein